MHDIPLNDTKRIFADKNHNLVYKFLHEKNLPASEYYDIVIFGYLRAVQRYLTDPNLAGYSFSTVAWRAMEGEVVNTHRPEGRRNDGPRTGPRPGMDRCAGRKFHEDGEKLYL